MKKLIVIFVIFFHISQILFSQSADDICSYWRTVKGNTQFQIYKAPNGKYIGKIVWLRIDKDRSDLNNPDPKLKQRKILGLQIISDFTYNAKKKVWENGKIYDPENGRTYLCKVWFERDKYILYLRGHVEGMKLLSRESNLIRESKLHQ